MDYDDYNTIGIIHMITQTHWYSPLLVLSLAKWIIVIPMKKYTNVKHDHYPIILLCYYPIILFS